MTIVFIKQHYNPLQEDNMFRIQADRCRKTPHTKIVELFLSVKLSRGLNLKVEDMDSSAHHTDISLVGLEMLVVLSLVLLS